MNRSAFIRFAAVGAFGLLTAPSSRAGVSRYSVTNLNEAYGNNRYEFISENGTISGYARAADGIYRNVLVVREGRIKEFEGYNGEHISEFTGFNDAGHAFGSTQFQDGTNRFVALNANGQFDDVGHDVAGMGATLGKQNSSGVAVGYEFIDSNPRPNGVSVYGFIYQSGLGVTNVGYLGGGDFYTMHAINDFGWIVGTGKNADGNGALMMWIPGEEAITLIESNTSVGTPHDVNNVGAVIGEFGFRAFHWYDGVVTPVGRRYVEDPSRPGRINDASGASCGLDINNSGMAVGWSLLRSVPGYVAAHQQGGWLWSEANGTEWLDDLVDPALGLHFGSAIAINDSGQILARTLINGEVIHYLLNPIPEPRCAVHLLAAVVVVVLRRRGR